MNLENGKVILDSFRVIGLKNSDMEKLFAASQKQESSFSGVDQVIEAALAPDSETVVVTDAPKVEAPVMQVEPQSFTPGVADTVSGFTAQPNMFDVPVENQSVSEPQMNVMPNYNEPVFTQPVPEQNMNVGMTPDFNNVYNNGYVEDVQGGPQVSVDNLDTPQTFYDRVEQENSNQVTQAQNDYYNQDPAILMVDNIKKVIEDKNSIIKDLSDRVNVLENQLRVSEEARKVSEAQRLAAETTLAEARRAESMNMSQNGPVLTYQQQPNGYQQAA